MRRERERQREREKKKSKKSHINKSVCTFCCGKLNLISLGFKSFSFCNTVGEGDPSILWIREI